MMRICRGVGQVGERLLHVTLKSHCARYPAVGGEQWQSRQGPPKLLCCVKINCAGGNPTTRLTD
jgi:hypothetical protein